MFLRAFHSVRFMLMKKVHTDNFIFHLHYRWTVLILLAFSFVITCRLFVGHSFTCYSRSEGLPTHTLDTLCYQGQVYVEQKELYAEIRGGESGRIDGDVKKYFTHYNWVNLVLLVHAFLFYLPHLLWKIFERSYIFRLTTGIDNVFIGEDRRNMELCLLAKYVLTTQGKHKLFTLFYIFTELANYVISLLMTIWLVHFFQVIKDPEIQDLTLESWKDFSEFYFPLKGRCLYHIRGSSGDMQRHSALCILPLNNLYMYIFLFLYGWYVFMTILSGLVIIYRLCLLVPGLRSTVLTMSSSLANNSVLASICARSSYHDWFFLRRLMDNLSDVDFAQLVDKISAASHYSKTSENVYEGVGQHRPFQLAETPCAPPLSNPPVYEGMNDTDLNITSQL